MTAAGATRAPGGGALARGAGVLAAATLAANAGNYALNLLLGRWLTPAEFADATLMVTLMLTITAVAACLQLVAARFVGTDRAGSTPLVAALTARSWVAGAVIGLVLAAAAPVWQQVFRTASPWPFVVLGVGIPCYLAQAVGRGVLQGEFRFGRLAVSFVVEMVVRLVGGIAGVALGFGVIGATVGLSVSFVATWLVVRGARPGVGMGWKGSLPQRVRTYAASVGLLLVAQILLLNGDMLVAKIVLAPEAAGVYAAVALIGRAVFFVSWAATTVAFPAAARRHAAGEPTGSLMLGGAAAVAGLGAVCTAGAFLLGGPVLEAMFGRAYAGLSPVLAEYALVTTLFAVANFVASITLSTGRTRESWLLLAGAVAKTAALLLGSATVASLVRPQLVAVSALLVVVLLSLLTGRAPAPTGPSRTQELANR